MVNRRKGRKYPKGFVAIRVDKQITLTTLGDATIIAADLFGGNLVEDLWVNSVHLLWTIRGHTGGEGPIEVGVAHGDYTTAELQEWATSNQFDPDDLIDKERNRRLVRSSGMFPGLATEEALNNGTPLKTVVKFLIGDGKPFNIWALNSSGATLTTGTVVEIHGTVFGRWIR